MLLICACAVTSPSSVERPGWVGGSEPAGYPRARYLTGVGSAHSLEQARDRARAELARAFEVRVEARARHEDQLSMADGETRHQGQLVQSVTTTTAATLRGVEIAETWCDPEAGHCHALATLDRQRAATALRETIAGLDAATGVYLHAAEQAEDKLREVAALARAIAEQRQRTEYQQFLRVLTGRGVATRHNLALLEARLEDRMDALRFAVTATGDHPAYIAERLKGGLGRAGFTVAEGRADYQLEVELRLKALGERDGWYWQRGRLALRLREPGGGSRGEHRWPVRSAATDRASAERRALDEVAEHLGEGLQAVVLALARGTDGP
ncbi:MAG: LPP20 family lipoprotein [Halorhodospira sp.]